MALIMYRDPIVSTKPKVEGPSVSISFRRGQVTFSDEAAKMMGLVVDKSHIEIGYDDEAKQLVFIVTTEAAEYKAKVENLYVKATDANVSVIRIWSFLDLIKGVSKETACRYPLHSGDGLFYINFSEGVEKPKAKSQSKKKVED